MKAKTCVLLLTALLSTASFGEIYKWTDENGKQHFSNVKPDTVVDAQEVQVKQGSFVQQDQTQLENTQRGLDERRAQRQREQARSRDIAAQNAMQERRQKLAAEAQKAAEDREARRLQDARNAVRNSGLYGKDISAPRAR
ncbi:DUF4124 domain-containing protein [Pseudomonas sp. PDM14]|uniref:DUF4124 domain-containing protein n=1 Tax=Pseudomonas sp. PDM14 TaxID=2769288 RepID=UPI00177FDA78|nr:DUF4124 domain-containing protein [Pseudomonas sp. PDM14]MBD9485182.1 DUF4124 domain-containing protein [Pseudomonas sp. PDM14]